MMLSHILSFLCLAAVLSAVLTGRAAETGAALLDGASAAVTFLLSLAPSMCLWSGLLQLLERCGGSQRIAAALRPVLGKLFPVSASDPETLAAVTENVGANLLGLGNAATPAGIRAVRGMKRLGDAAADELCLFVVLNTASLQLLPTAIASLRAAAGASAPFDILPAVLMSSALSVAGGLLTAALLRRLWRKRGW